ncbi:uncharacterized protein BDV14DRAFT_195221 [Aspergillus stella-maris]|uniref:uncharacterized protein n=1 Tax=Aspergillus stella-maris TaxID=1810926 RepID=UPI003CCD16F1
MACAWDSELELLLVMLLSSGPHASTSAEFTTMMHFAVDPNLHNRRITPIGRESPDASWVPRDLTNRDKSRFPSVVMEIKSTDSAAKEKLQSDVRFWFQASRVTIDKWVHIGDGRYTIQQHIIITEPREGKAAVDGGPLTIDLEHILRRPSTDPAEGNTIEIPVNELEELANNA